MGAIPLALATGADPQEKWKKGGGAKQPDHKEDERHQEACPHQEGESQWASYSTGNTSRHCQHDQQRCQNRANRITRIKESIDHLKRN